MSVGFTNHGTVYTHTHTAARTSLCNLTPSNTNKPRDAPCCCLNVILPNEQRVFDLKRWNVASKLCLPPVHIIRPCRSLNIMRFSDTFTIAQCGIDLLSSIVVIFLLLFGYNVYIYGHLFNLIRCTIKTCLDFPKSSNKIIRNLSFLPNEKCSRHFKKFTIAI